MTFSPCDVRNARSSSKYSLVHGVDRAACTRMTVSVEFGISRSACSKYARGKIFSAHKGERIGLCYSGTGCIYGFVDLVESIGPLTPQEWCELRHRHRVTKRCRTVKELPYGGRTCGWVVANPQRLETPIKIVRSRGAVIWQGVNL